MTVPDLIQLMRTCSLDRVRIELEKLQVKDKPLYEKLVLLYIRASKK